jgi:hypothetical protein
MTVDIHGDFYITGTVEQVLDMSFRNIGSLMPSHSFDNDKLYMACKNIATLCPKYRIIGCLSVEIYVWNDEKNNSQYAVRNLSTYSNPAILRLQVSQQPSFIISLERSYLHRTKVHSGGK